MAIIMMLKRKNVNVLPILQVELLRRSKRWKNVNHAVVKSGDK